MQRFWKELLTLKYTSGMLGPGADEAFAPLTTPKIKQRVLVAHLTVKYRLAIQQYIGRPLGRRLLQRWMQNKTASQCVEAFGLPRHIIEEVLGDDALTLHVDPRKLTRITEPNPQSDEKRPSSLAFIWNGSWDQYSEDLRDGSRYQLISELDENRGQLERTTHFQKLMACIEQGSPWASHQKGVLLDSSEKIRDYLQIYIDFMDDMAINGFDPSRGKDALGIAITRHGRIVKVNRGLHRLAMAQRVGLPSIPVRVRSVHRLWWNEVTQGSTGIAALEKLQAALQHCTPEDAPEATDDSAMQATVSTHIWPAPRYLQQESR